MPSCDSNRKNIQIKVNPLLVSGNISPYGLLTISFNKPIILPPIRVDSIKSITDSHLIDENVGIKIKDVIGLRVASDFYDRDYGCDSVSFLVYSVS